MRIALIGASGQLGTDLHQQLVGEVIPVDHARCDITDPARVAALLDEIRPDMVVNTAAYNLVDKAEIEPEAAEEQAEEPAAAPARRRRVK